MDRGPIQECPVFTPNRREFADPLAYIRSIRQEGQRYGIVRIIPPDDWHPPLAMDLDSLKFRTRIQQIDKLQNRSRDVTQSEFMRRLSEVVADVVVPRVDEKPLDCLFLYQEVCERKGFLEVSRKKQWVDIAKAYILAFKAFSGNTEKAVAKPLALTFRTFYERCLLPMERLDNKRRKLQTPKKQSAAWEAPKWTPSKDEKLDDETKSTPPTGEIEALLAHQRQGVGYRYLVLWKGEALPTWESRSRLSLQARNDYEIFFPDEFGQCKDLYENNTLGLSQQEWRELRKKVKKYRTKWAQYHEVVKATFADGIRVTPDKYVKIWRELDNPPSVEPKVKVEVESEMKPEVVKPTTVESILTHVKDGTEYRYLVLWEGETDPTWQSRNDLPRLARCEYEAFYPEEFGTVSDDEENLPLREVRSIRGKERTEKWTKYRQLVKSTFENNELVEASAYAKLWRSLPVSSTPCECRRTRSSSTPTPVTSEQTSTSPSTTRLKNILRSTSSPSVPSSQKRTKIEPTLLADSKCLHCNGTDFKDKLLTCSWCHGMFHTFCLMPTSAPENLPPSRWICFGCRAANDGFGFDTGEMISVADYRKQADAFAHKRFPRGVTEKEVIQEYWKIVEGEAPPATVQYGSDIDTLEHGSGFPTSGIYARSGWNLCNLPKVANSLLKHLTNISGITVPWFYAGMMFSSFCWHNEDHYCYSINYVHTGAPKQWYGVPGLKSPEFEACAAQTLPDLFRIQPDLLYQMVTMLSPFVLRAHGVPVYTTTQQPGQFVVTFPQAYHAGFNHGFNMAEAVNFAPADWLSFGVRGMEHYRRMHRTPVFPHDLLMCRLAADPCTGYDELAWLLAGLRRMVNEERAARLTLYAEGVRIGIRWDEQRKSNDRPSVENLDPRNTKMMKGGRESLHHLAECCLCRHALWVSCVKCGRCNSDRITCLRHGHLLCACPAKEKQLLFRYSTEELETLVTQVTANLRKHEESMTKRKQSNEPVTSIVDIVAENSSILESLPLLDEDCKRNSTSQDNWHDCIQEWVNEVDRVLHPGKQKVLNKLLVQELLAAAAELNWGDRSVEVRKLEEELKGYELLINNLNVLSQAQNNLKPALLKCGYSSLPAFDDFLQEVANSPILCDGEHLKIIEHLTSLLRTSSAFETKLRFYAETRAEDAPVPTMPFDTGPVTLFQLLSLHEEALGLALTLPATPKLGLVLKAVNQWMDKVRDIMIPQAGMLVGRYEAACNLLRQGTTWDTVKDVLALHVQLKALIDQTEANALSIRFRFGVLLDVSSVLPVTNVQYADLQSAILSTRAVFRTREAIQLERIIAAFDQWSLNARPKLTSAANNLESFSVAELSEFLTQLPPGLEGVLYQNGIVELVRARRWLDEVLALPGKKQLDTNRPAITDAQQERDFDSLKPSLEELHDLVTRGRTILDEQPVGTEWVSLFNNYLETLSKREAKGKNMMDELSALMSSEKSTLKLVKWWLHEVESFPVRLPHYFYLRGAVRAAEGWLARVETLLGESPQVTMACTKELLDELRTLPVEMAGSPTLERLEMYDCEARELLQHIGTYLTKSVDIPSLQMFLVREPPQQAVARVREQVTQAKALLSRVTALKLSADCVKSLQVFSWRLTLRLEVAEFTSIEQLQEALDKSASLQTQIPSLEEDSVSLKALLEKSRSWVERAQTTENNLKQTSVAAVVSLVQESHLLPFVLPVEASLKDLIRRVRNWLLHVTVFLEPQVDDAFELSQLIASHVKGVALQIPLPELEMLSHVIETARSCQKALEALFPRPSVLALKDLLANILQEDKIEVHCLCFQEKPGSAMVCCDDCDRWFHHKCVQVTNKEVAKLDRYSCPSCCEKRKVAYPFGSCLFRSTFPSLIKLQNVITEFKAFPAISRFSLFLQSQDVFLRCYNFRKHVRSVLRADPNAPHLAQVLTELAIKAKRLEICRKEVKLIAARTWAINTKKLLAPNSQTSLDILQDALRDAPPKEDLLMPGLPAEDSSNVAWVDILATLVQFVAWGRMFSRGVCSADPAIAARDLAILAAKTSGAVKINWPSPSPQFEAVASNGRKRKSTENAESPAKQPTSPDFEKRQQGEVEQDAKPSQKGAQKETLYCVCRKPYANEFMVACDECDEWYHPGCIKKTKAEIESTAHFICGLC